MANISSLRSSGVENSSEKSAKTDEALLASNKYLTSLEKAKRKATREAKRRYRELKEKTDRTIRRTTKRAKELYKKAEKIVKDPKNKELIKVVVDLYDDYMEKREKERERDRDEIASKTNKNLENYTFEGVRDAEIGEVMTSCQIICVNTHAIVLDLEKTNKKGETYLATNGLGDHLKELGIVPNILSGSTSLFKNGVGDFESFKEDIKILDSEGDLDNAAEVLACSAIGKYQIVPFYHFDRVKGWKTGDTEFKLKMMYLYLRSESHQNALAKKIIEYKNKKYNGNALVMAASYYGGPGGAIKMKKYLKAKKNGEITDTTSLEKEQSHGYKSIMDYSELVVKYQKEYQRKHPELSFTETFQMAIAKKESGYLRNKKVKI
ncbi:hypothetical protein JW758_01560 [Candidatus Peregrinibacteria bacterium]|nr:hypothetical protein [Candidatus Peregrinibacteria bacterium]